MANRNTIDEKFKNDKLKFEVIKNENLVCKDCQYKYDDTEMPCNTSKCAKFPVKPNEVIDGGDCHEYKEKR